jgi:hypothetical protein
MAKFHWKWNLGEAAMRRLGAVSRSEMTPIVEFIFNRAAFKGGASCAKRGTIHSRVEYQSLPFRNQFHS